MKFLVANYMATRILVVDLVRLLAEKVVNIVDLAVHQLLLYFVVEIVVLPYSEKMM